MILQMSRGPLSSMGPDGTCSPIDTKTRVSFLRNPLVKAHIAKSCQRQMYAETNWILKSLLPREPSSLPYDTLFRQQ